MNIKIKTLADVSNYMTERMEIALGTKNIFRVSINFVPTLQKWFCYVNGMPQISVELHNLNDVREFHACENVTSLLIGQLKEYFAHV